MICQFKPVLWNDNFREKKNTLEQTTRTILLAVSHQIFGYFCCCFHHAAEKMRLDIFSQFVLFEETVEVAVLPATPTHEMKYFYLKFLVQIADICNFESFSI